MDGIMLHINSQLKCFCWLISEKEGTHVIHLSPGETATAPHGVPMY